MLDIACGTGIALSGAVNRGAVARGLDFSAAMLAVARARTAAVAFDEGDAEALPYADGVFDAVVSNFGIHHVPQPACALREAHRVLREGGRVALSFWADPSDNVAWRLLFDAISRRGDPAAAHAPPPGGGFRSATRCADALRAAGFADCTTRLVRATWHHADARALVAALQAGTARMAAMIEAQCPRDLHAIITEIETSAGAYRCETGIDVPIAAVIAAGDKR